MFFLFLFFLRGGGGKELLQINIWPIIMKLQRPEKFYIFKIVLLFLRW